MNSPYFLALCVGLIALSLLPVEPAFAQTPLKEIAFTDFSFTTSPSKNWRLVGDVQADIEESNNFKTQKGNGILVNLFDKRKPGNDLLFNLQHGDIDLELDYMIAKSANSGIYMQGRYEIQLADSWTEPNPKANDNGGVYERWDDSKPEGEKGFEGSSPRQNVSRAPGLWQHLKVSFQAPRFNGAGKKTENARILLLELNGVRIQENVDLSGPTRGALNSPEQPLGPLRLQGDHGAVAFRNIRYAFFDKPRPELSDLKYAVYKGNFDTEPDYKKLPPEAEGTSTILTSNISQLQNEFLIHYTGNLKIAQPGEYSFNLQVPGGSGLMRIADQLAIPVGEGSTMGKINLQSGVFPFELYYSKIVDWARPALGLSVAGPGIREYLISDANVNSGEMVDPILINPTTENMILRSFIDLKGGKRVTHAISVGSNKQVHYTYDADNGMMVQLWRGRFLDATPMWHERGDGSSVAAGSVHQFGNPSPIIQKLANSQSAFATDTAGSGFRFKGYSLDKSGSPTFSYHSFGTVVTDAIKILDNGQGIHRELEPRNNVENLYARLISAHSIEEIGNGRYLINDKSFYLQIDDFKNSKALIRSIGGMTEILLPLQKKISYSVLF